MAPSVISMMAWLHRLPWPLVAAWEEAPHSEELRLGQQQVCGSIRVCVLEANLIQDFEGFFHGLCNFSLSLHVKLIH
jgi:hypothetical protein